MKTKNFPLIFLFSVLVSMVLLNSVFINIASVRCYEEYVYYGYVPSRIFTNITTTYGEIRYEVKDIATRAILGIVSNYDDTNVEVHILPTKELVEKFTLDELEKKLIHLPNGTFFKVVADKPISVMLMGGLDLEEGDATISTFYTSKKGGYVGKEFNFIAVQSSVGMPYTIFALEDSNITIIDEDGTKIYEFSLLANEVKRLTFKSFKAYKMLSTGYVMLQTFTISRSCFYPAVHGGFIGNVFYGMSGLEWKPPGGGQFRAGLARSFIITGVQDSKISIMDLDYKKKLVDANVAAGSNLTLTEVKAMSILVKSEHPVMLMFKSDDWEGGLTFVGLKANQTAYVYIPVGESYIFTYKDTLVNIDDTIYTISADGFLQIPEGLHKIFADQNIMIEIVNVVSNQGVVTFGSCIPSVQSLDFLIEDLKLKLVMEQEMPWMQTAIISIVAVAILTGVIYFLVKKRGDASR